MFDLELFSNFLKAHAQNLGDAQKVPIGKPVSRQPVKIENMDLDQIQQNLTNSIKKPKAAGSTGIKLDQGDSAVSMETLMDVKSQQLRGIYKHIYKRIYKHIYKDILNIFFAQDIINVNNILYNVNIMLILYYVNNIL